VSSSKDSSAPKIVQRPKWVVVQLTSFAERERNVEAIKRAAKRILGDVEVLVPAVQEKAREEELTTFYMDGYIFIKYQEKINYMKLSDTPYFKTVLINPPRSGNSNPYQLIDDKILNPVRSGMKEITKSSFKVAQRVQVIKGTYKNMDGVVVAVFPEKDQVQIRVPLRSKPLLVNFPASFLEKMKEYDE
jgi:transcription antitermination factor NusG